MVTFTWMRITINNFSNRQITGIDLKMRKRIGYLKISRCAFLIYSDKSKSRQDSKTVIKNAISKAFFIF